MGKLDEVALIANARRRQEIQAGSWVGGIQALEEYQTRPIDFAVDKLGIKRNTLVWSENPGYEGLQWDGTPEPMVAWSNALAEGRNVGIESATGTGKSFNLGWLTLWFLSCWMGARFFSYASKEEALTLYSWTEIKKLWPEFEKLFPSAELTHLRILMAGSDGRGDLAGWGAWGRSAGVGAEEEIASKAAGMHAAHMLIAGEEAQGLPLPVSRALRNTATGTHNILCYAGNPDHQTDTLHLFCTSDDVEHIVISALDHPNVVVNNHRDPNWSDIANDIEVVPGAVSRKSVLARKLEYGEGDPLYQSRVRGISPAQAQDSIIKRDWCIAAAGRYNDPELREGIPSMAADVAESRSGDKAAIAHGLGACLLEVESMRVGEGHAIEDPVQFGAEIAKRMKSNDPPILSRHVGVDADNIGSGTVAELKRLGYRVRAIKSATRPIPRVDTELRPADYDPDKPEELAQWREDERIRSVVREEVFLNLRAQMWWQMRLDLQHGRIALPWDDELFDDLCAPRRVPNAKIQVEKKDDIRKRLEDRRSPDKGDAAVYWNWVRYRGRATLPKLPKIPENEPNRDWGLEEMAIREAKNQKKERQIHRQLLKNGGIW